MKTATCCQEKCQTTEQKSAQQKLSTTWLCQELAAPSRAVPLPSLEAGVLRGWNLELGGLCRRAAAGLGVKLQRCPARPPSGLPPPPPPPLSCFLLPLGVGLGPREVMPAPFCKSTGPWLYGDSEACTEYVQNDFFTSKVERHPFDKGPFGEGYRRKLRVPFVPKATAGSWHRA